MRGPTGCCSTEPHHFLLLPIESKARGKPIRASWHFTRSTLTWRTASRRLDRHDADVSVRAASVTQAGCRFVRHNDRNERGGAEPVGRGRPTRLPEVHRRSCFVFERRCRGALTRCGSRGSFLVDGPGGAGNMTARQGSRHYAAENPSKPLTKSLLHIPRSCAFESRRRAPAGGLSLLKWGSSTLPARVPGTEDRYYHIPSACTVEVNGNPASWNRLWLHTSGGEGEVERSATASPCVAISERSRPPRSFPHPHYPMPPPRAAGGS